MGLKIAVIAGGAFEAERSLAAANDVMAALKEAEHEPELAMRVAVRGMMPRNTVTKDSLKRLHIYAGEQHIHEAQKPEPVK